MSAPVPAALLRVLRCPVCEQGLTEDGRRLLCPAGHAFDRARQGSVTLGRGRRPSQNADTAAMVAARAELLASGLYDPVRAALAAAVAAALPPPPAEPDPPDEPDEPGPASAPPVVADLAGGTGWYLAGVLDHLPEALGLCLDLSAPALRRAARASPRALAVGADLRDPFPLRDSTVDVATSVFGPRAAAETARVLTAGGALVVVTPEPDHLAELAAPLGLVGVDAAKDERLTRSLPGFTRRATTSVRERLDVDRHRARALAAMGPSAHHTTAQELDARVAGLAATTPVTLAVTVSTWTPPPEGATIDSRADR
ncbi:putative RNA methyltransferase [Pseudokineococcus sp. 1T1Z-3]|uniref:putative RNA methyltransferase n=1 Tax=Pseudokineococcus sp. 1T1Z-3 TaxID=3132745 RepID=UPI003099B344